MNRRWSWLGAAWGMACVGEAPPLPIMTGLVDDGSPTTPGTTATAPTTTTATATASTEPSEDDTTSASMAECGNGDVELGEDCDGIDWQGATCESLGFDGGALECGMDCSFITSGCTYACGNGIIDPTENCEGLDLAEATCESLGLTGGRLACSETCHWNLDGCAVPAGMVLVPGGTFTMGSDGYADERPIRQVHEDAFLVDATEVTVAAYGECVTAGICTAPLTDSSCNWMVAGREDHPVNCVSWLQADQFCSWAEGGSKRLPTEAEWEKAARGVTALEYPWGNGPQPTCTLAVMDEDGPGCTMATTWPVGSKPLGASPYGALDMAGNVREWVSDWYASSYEEGAVNNPTGPGSGTQRVMRGGSLHDNSPFAFRTADRSKSAPDTANFTIGFRCVWDLPAM
ncbi:formylglycine-generating enzyme family protein [Paraliomyxa miuraensis]|uniref:formylglycine-generating enzyme family protein n=1 Tax=Paraliomyxa miuraensis TaxID=376150 RepID=UPI00225B5843|nr:SUMF1/EgtB/PvdO family nonheme iron enzyme [Paraliomyxa miuraensis]MCX4243459.1 formylglycine-generating enzyme family protein [Paraliomyxa miuraensis]